jgi:hypothetical protein
MKPLFTDRFFHDSIGHMFAEMSGVTEIACAPLKKGINVTDPGSDAYKTLTEEAFRLIKGWKGCQRIFWELRLRTRTSCGCL